LIIKFVNLGWMYLLSPSAIPGCWQKNVRWEKGEERIISLRSTTKLLQGNTLSNVEDITFDISSNWLSHSSVLIHRPRHQGKCNSPGLCRRFSSDTCNDSA